MGATATELAPRMIEVISLADGTRHVLPLPVGESASLVVGSTARDVLLYERHPGGDRDDRLHLPRRTAPVLAAGRPAGPLA